MFMEENKSQVALKLKLSDEFHLDDYFISNSNKDAYSATTNQILGIKPYDNVLIIRGAKSSGKSFLAKIVATTQNGKIISSLEEFDSLNLYIIDDPEKLDETNILHIFNHTVNNKKKLILFANKNWNIKLKDLSSRINSIKGISINEPDDELMEVIISREFSKRSIEVGRDVINYLKTRIERNFQKIFMFIDGLDKFCLTNKRNITVKAASEFMASYIKFPDKYTLE
jgi:chromosomal replication initiation ATPase DnaA